MDLAEFPCGVGIKQCNRSKKRFCAEEHGYDLRLPKWMQSLSEQEMKEYEECKNDNYNWYINQNVHDNNDKTYQTQVNNARMRWRGAQLAAKSVGDMTLEELENLVQDGYIYD